MSRLTRRAMGSILLAVHFCYGRRRFPLSVSKHRPGKGKGLVPMRCTVVTVSKAPSKGRGCSTSVTTTCLHLMERPTGPNIGRPSCLPRTPTKLRHGLRGGLLGTKFAPRGSPRKGLTLKCNYISMRQQGG